MIKIQEEINLEGYILILPSVAIGNVGQLCADLLITNLNLCKIGSMWSSTFLPISGLDPYNKDSTSLCTATDFYLGTNYKIILLQIRSPYIGDSTNFFDELTKFVQEKKIQKVIILASGNKCYNSEEAGRSDTRLRYLTSDDTLLNNEKLLQDLQWKRHVTRIENELTVENCIPGGGFANSLYNHLKSVEIYCTVLFCYCYEGDNVSDAIILVKGLNQWLNLLESNSSAGISIKYPPSWEYFFGNPPSSEIY